MGGGILCYEEVYGQHAPLDVCAGFELVAGDKELGAVLFLEGGVFAQHSVAYFAHGDVAWQHAPGQGGDVVQEEDVLPLHDGRVEVLAHFVVVLQVVVSRDEAVKRRKDGLGAKGFTGAGLVGVDGHHGKEGDGVAQKLPEHGGDNGGEAARVLQGDFAAVQWEVPKYPAEGFKAFLEGPCHVGAPVYGEKVYGVDFGGGVVADGGGGKAVGVVRLFEGEGEAQLGNLFYLRHGEADGVRCEDDFCLRGAQAGAHGDGLRVRVVACGRRFFAEGVEVANVLLLQPCGEAVRVYFVEEVFLVGVVDDDGAVIPVFVEEALRVPGKCAGYAGGKLCIRLFDGDADGGRCVAGICCR